MPIEMKFELPSGNSQLLPTIYPGEWITLKRYSDEYTLQPTKNITIFCNLDDKGGEVITNDPSIAVPINPNSSGRQHESTVVSKVITGLNKTLGMLALEDPVTKSRIIAEPVITHKN